MLDRKVVKSHVSEARRALFVISLGVLFGLFAVGCGEGLLSGVIDLGGNADTDVASDNANTSDADVTSDNVNKSDINITNENTTIVEIAAFDSENPDEDALDSDEDTDDSDDDEDSDDDPGDDSDNDDSDDDSDDDCEDDRDCDDGIPCTVDSCNETTDSCNNIPDDTLCDDGLSCNGDETCDAELGCQPGTPIDCDDGIDCTVDTCNEAAGGTCDHTPDDTLCDDGEDCTDDMCDADVDCLNTPIDVDPAWVLKSTDGPSPRYNHAMVYDSCREVVVLVGGQDNSTSPTTYFEDTWEWDGDTWALRATTGPGFHRSHGMAFDESRCVVVLFGGNDPDGNYLNDTWEWNGSTWAERCANCSPPTRHYPGMAYDSALGEVLLFGGWSPGYLNDLWKWDGTSWEAVPTTAPKPSPRSSFAMEYDPVRDCTLVFGGAIVAASCAVGNTTDDMWELDTSTSPATWTLVCPAGGGCGTTPSPRSVPLMVYDSARSMMVLFGGWDGCSTVIGDTWEWNGIIWTQVAAAGPGPRYKLDMAYDATRKEIVLVGGLAGETSPVVGDTWVYGGGCP